MRKGATVRAAEIELPQQDPRAPQISISFYRRLHA